MGQKPSQQLAPKDKEVLSVCEVVSGAIIHAAQKLKAYLGFEDTLSNWGAPDTMALIEGHSEDFWKSG